MAVITSQELATYLQVEGSPTDSMDLAVELGSGIVTGHVGQSFESASYTQLLPVAVGDYTVELPQRPVTAVASVTLPVAGLLDSDESMWLGVSAVVQLDVYESTATVAYTAGYAEIPNDVKAVALAVAARVYQNPVDARTEQIDDYSVTYAAGSGGGVNAVERRILRRYSMAAGSVILR